MNTIGGIINGATNREPIASYLILKIILIMVSTCETHVLF